MGISVICKILNWILCKYFKSNFLFLENIKEILRSRNIYWIQFTFRDYVDSIQVEEYIWHWFQARREYKNGQDSN